MLIFCALQGSLTASDAGALPAAEIQNFDYEPKEPPAFGKIRIKTTVKNPGPGSVAPGEIGKMFVTPGAYNASLWIDPLILTGELSPGATAVIEKEVPVELSPDDYRIVIELHAPAGKIHDAKDPAVHREIVFSVAAGAEPRLIIDHFSVIPASPKNGERVHARVSVKNDGRNVLSRGKWAELRLIESRLSQVLWSGDVMSTKDLKPGKKFRFKKIEIPVDLREGRYDLSLQILPHPGERVNEISHEKKGILRFTVEPASNANLSIRDLSITPRFPRVGDRVSWEIRIANDGDRPKAAARIGSLTLSSGQTRAVLERQELILEGTLDPGKESVLTGRIETPAQSQNYALTARLEDKGKRVVDKTAAKFREVRFTGATAQAGDVVIDEFRAAPEKPLENEKVRVTVAVKNKGDFSIPAGIIGRLRIVENRDWILWSENLSMPNELAPGNSYKFPDRLLGPFKPGFYKAVLQISAEEENLKSLLPEKMKEILLIVGGLSPAKPSISEFYITPNKPTVSSLISAVASLKNEGAKPLLPGPAIKLVLISENDGKILFSQTLENADAVEPGRVFRFPPREFGPLAAGDYRLIATIAGKRPDEKFAADEWLELPFKVRGEKPPEIVIKDFQVKPPVTYEEQPVLSWSAANIGEASAEPGPWADFEVYDFVTGEKVYERSYVSEIALEGRKTLEFTPESLPLETGKKYRAVLQVKPKRGERADKVHKAKRRETVLDLTNV